MKQIVYTIKTFAVTALALFAVGCAGDDATQSTEQPQEAGLVTFVGGAPGDASAQANSRALTTRTSISHVQGNGATPLWSTGDKIWVKDNSGVFQQSAAGVFNSTMARGTFTFSSGTYSNGCQVNYTGNSASGTEVTIASTQTQTTPNDFSHAGASGDCGTASASGDGTTFDFRLDHKAAYLCFLPRCENTALGPNIYLTKIVVTADTPIAGQYDFTDGTLTGKTPTGASNSITLVTNNFPLDNADSDIDNNGAYMVIAPGTYNLKVNYYLQDPTTGTEGFVTKTLSGLACLEGTINDITAWVDKDITVYANQMYMWDAPVGKTYWSGVSGYPLTNNAFNSAYPQSSADARWYNEGPGFASGAPSRSAANMPSANEYVWYAQKGDPHWDADQLWTMDNHLYKAGMWIKKWANIPNATASATPTGKDLNTDASGYYDVANLGATPAQGRPAQTVISQYFFIPATGFYENGKLVVRGNAGYNTSKTAMWQPDYTVMFWFNSAYIGVGVNKRSLGISSMPMQ